MLPEKDSLQHYASPYYDPVKAHEYYMRTRELKGRRSSSKLNDEGKKVWSYTKEQISENKKADTEEERNQRDRKIAEYRDKASKTREAISNRLKQLKEALTESSKRERESISREQEAEIERIEKEKNDAIEKIRARKIPEGISDEQRARLIERRNSEIAKLENDATAAKANARSQSVSDRVSLTENTQRSREQYSADAARDREEVSTKLKSAISAAREAYKAAKESLDQSYETIYQTEYDKILAEYAK